MPTYQPGTPRSDQVPTSGLWQTDPVIAEYIRYYNSRPVLRARGTPAAADPEWQRKQKAYSDYIKANRRRLGIPDNYTPDPRTNGQTLYDPAQNQFRDAAITGASLLGVAVGAPALASLFGPGAAPAAPLLTNTANPALASILPPAILPGGAAAIPSAASALLPTLPTVVPPLASTLPGALPAAIPPAADALLPNNADPSLANPNPPTVPGGNNALPSITRGGRTLTDALRSGMSLRDWLNLGTDVAGSLINADANRDAAEANAKAQQEALDFLKQQHADQMARDKERWDAYELRRSPYRQAAGETLDAFKRLIGIPIQ